MTDTELINLLKADIKRLEGEAADWKHRCGMWEVEAEKMTKKYLTAETEVIVAQKSEARTQQRLDALQRAYNALSDEVITDFDTFLERMATK